MSGLAVSLAGVFGVGQTWQNVKASRALSTTYTNTTGKPILVSVCSTATSNNVNAEISVDGVLIEQNQTAGGTLQAASVQAVVPNGSQYSVTGNGGLVIGGWMELR